MDTLTIVLIAFSSAFFIALVITIFIMLSGKKSASNQNISNVDDQQLKEQISKAITEGLTSILTGVSSMNTKSQEDIVASINKNFQSKADDITGSIGKLNESVQKTVGDEIQKYNKTLNEIIERVTRLDEVQKQMDKMDKTVADFTRVLNNPSARGAFGEIQLNAILANIFGSSKELYELQYSVGLGRVDAIIKAPQPLGNIPIDSKFPMESFNKTVDKYLSSLDKKEAKKAFEIQMKKHIDDIANKYIVAGVTSEYAIMFIPAESIFAELYANYEKTIEYALDKKILFASPSNLVYMLTTVRTLIKNIQTNDNLESIKAELAALGDEFRRFMQRWDIVKKAIVAINKGSNQLDITVGKIEKFYNRTYNLEFSEKDDEISLDAIDTLE